MSDTPRTNAVLKRIYKKQAVKLEIVYFARKLERENAALRKALAQIADPEHRHFISRMETARDALAATRK